MIRYFLTLLLLPCLLHAAGISYTVGFEGVEDSSILKAMKSASQLSSFKKHPPASIHALRYRAEADIPEFLKVLKANGYYEAKVSVRMQEEEEHVQAIVTVYMGPRYTIGSYNIVTSQGCPHITLEKTGISLGAPALAVEILNAELKVLGICSTCGYPLAQVSHREMQADGATKTLHITLKIQAGDLCYFGETELVGNTSVKSSFIRQKTAWKQGDIYNAALAEQTQKALLDTGLFSSVLITHGTGAQHEGTLPMRIDVVETKHRSVNMGVSYQTFYGPGITFGWENRNISGLGRKVHIQGDATKRSHSGIATYMIPDFRRVGQDYLWQAQAMHQSITPYSERSYNLMNRIERKIGKRMRIGAGAKVEKLYVTNSVKNGIFLLFELPLYFRWSSANDLLNPTKGATFEYKLIPSTNFEKIPAYYFINKATQTLYLSWTKKPWFVLAQKWEIGSTPSHTLNAIPVPKRFFGGSEEDLRGYRYQAVSPLEHHHKPIGGRSALFYTIETRFRATEKIGFVPFFDLGCVYLSPLPKAKGKWFKSTGLGIRYFSFFGPLRLDIAFPLDRRPNIDPYYRILVSIGQTF